jgi:hypothetical protein
MKITVRFTIMNIVTLVTVLMVMIIGHITVTIMTISNFESRLRDVGVCVYAPL